MINIICNIVSLFSIYSYVFKYLSYFIRLKLDKIVGIQKIAYN